MAEHLLSVEKAWLLSQIGTLVIFTFRFRLAHFGGLGLIVDCDDDVMDEVRPQSDGWFCPITLFPRLAKMEFLLLATSPRIRQDAKGTRG